jgi:hypothetical protein
VRKHLWMFCLCGCVGACPLAAAPPNDKGKITFENVPYKGWKNNLRLSNGDVELIITLDVGPRIISYRLTDGKNVFKEYADQLGKSGEKEWQIRGGHRLWVGPEDTTRTYAPDNGPVRQKRVPSREGEHGVLVFQEAPPEYGLRKGMLVSLSDKGSRVTVQHLIENLGTQPTELAPWALSVMAPGGVEIIPLPPKMPHPGSAKNAKSPADFWPNQNLVLWPFFDFKDPRWTFGSRYILLKQDQRGPTKIGLAHREGWVGYLNGGTLFVKRFGYEEGKTYPDRGSNFETFTNEDMLEVETLGPLVKLPPGPQLIELKEEWELFGGLEGVNPTEDTIDAKILPKIRKP